MNRRLLEDRHAIVTGAGSGIGAATARRLSDLGASVTMVGRRRERLDEVAAALEQPFVAVADVVDDTGFGAAIQEASARFGPPAILVNNAGVALSKPFLKTSRQELESMLSVNVTGAFVATQAVLPAMIDTGWGRVVNVASTSALKGYAYVTAYCASKHALLGLTRALALETAAKGVTVNAVCPGFVDTEIVERAVDNIVGKTGRSANDARSSLAAMNPQGRLLSPEEVASAIAWLCLPESGGINGAAIAISGGEV